MDSAEFKKDFIESIKTAAAVTGEGSCESFVDNMAQSLNSGLITAVYLALASGLYVLSYRRMDKKDI